jgi:hypothetical protein
MQTFLEANTNDDEKMIRRLKTSNPIVQQAQAVSRRAMHDQITKAFQEK